MHRNGQTWSRNREYKILVAVGDTFVDKSHWSEVIRDYALQEYFSLRRIKNDSLRHIATCRNLNCTWKIHASPLLDGVKW